MVDSELLEEPEEYRYSSQTDLPHYRRRTSLTSPRTPTACVARSISRKYKRLQKGSPLSTSTRRLLLQKFAPPATPEVVSEVVSEVSPVLPYNQFLGALQERYSSLRTEEVKEDQEVWVVVSRLV